MSKKLSWLDQFAEEQAKKMSKTASLDKKAEQLIVDPEDVPGATNGMEIAYNNEMYRVVDANYADQMGNGIVLEKVAAVEEEEKKEDEVAVEEAPVAEEPAVEETPEAPVEEVPATEEVPAEIPADSVTTSPAVAETPMAPAAPMVTGPANLTDAPERARVETFDNQHIEVRDTVEVEKFNNEATETANQIAQENAVDGTTPEGRVNRVLQRMQTMMAPVAPVETPEAPVAEEVPTEEPAADDVEIEEEEVKK